MGKYIGPKTKLERRIGERLYLKGDRSQSTKDPFLRRSYPPGVHGPQQKTRLSEYGQQLREKQKAKIIYGLLERQFVRYFKKAKHQKGDTGSRLLQLLEMRLDNVVYRLNFAKSRRQARQLVNHGHVLINGRKVNIPSYQVKVGDVISLKEKSRKIPFVEELVKEKNDDRLPDWLIIEDDKLSGKVIGLPAGKDLELGIDSKKIVEFYSR